MATQGSDSTWSRLTTEARHPASHDLDAMATEDAVALLLQEDEKGLAAARQQSTEIALAAEWMADTLARGGDVLFAGAGTSGRLGVLEAAELPPTFGTDPTRVRATIAGGHEAVFAASEGAEDVEADGRQAVAELTSADLLIAVSASSVTPFVHGALAAARDLGARTVLLTCAAPAPEHASLADLSIALDTGPEILTGSTRLKAGSATKAVLNAITTAAMLRSGKVFGNLMVDLKTGSAKLRDRAIRIVAAGGRVSAERARSLLDVAGGEVKTAIVMACLEVPAEAARARLERASGHVRRALSAR